MQPDTLSLQRRRVMIAGSLGVATGLAAPAVAFAGQSAGEPATLPNSGRLDANVEGDVLIVSGRILGVDHKPLAGAMVETWHAPVNSHHATTTTDADGRFMLTTTVPAVHNSRIPNLSYRVSHEGRKLSEEQLYFTRESKIAGDRILQWQHDGSGAWRATCGLTVA